MTYDIHMNSLSKSQQKQLRQVYGMGLRKVEDIRAMLMIGPAGMVITAAMFTLFFIGLGLIFWPLLFLAPVALIAAPFYAVSENQKWRELLPPLHDGETVRLL